MSQEFQPATTIQEVIDRLNGIIDQSITDSSAFGIFPALYVVVTEKIKDGIARGDVFEDGPRMEKLDVLFANRFLESYHQYLNGEQALTAWMLSFQNAERFSRKVILQELLIAMNAHINLDLGIAAAQTAPGDAIKDLKKDFYAINEILSSLIDNIKTDIENLSPRFSWILRFFKGKEDGILDFSIRKARDAAWGFAVRLAHADDQKDIRIIEKRDKVSYKIGERIVGPGLLGRLVVWWVKRGEEKNINKIVTELRSNFMARVKLDSQA